MKNKEIFQAKQFGWLWGSSGEKQAEKKQVQRLRPSQVLQRRTNQFVNEIQVGSYLILDEVDISLIFQGNAIGNYKNLPPQPIINRKYPAPPISAQNKKGLKRPALPPPKRPQQVRNNV